MIRTLGGIAGGVAIAILTIMIVEATGTRLFPPVRGTELVPPEAPTRMPFQTLIIPVAGWLLGSLLGGATAVWFSRRTWTAWAVAGAVLVGALLQFALSPHPVWMMIAGVVAPIAGALLAQRLAPLGPPDPS